MAGFIAEARRLGLSEFIPYVSATTSLGNGADAEGLCITGCESCRRFRNRVRAAQAAESRQSEFDSYVQSVIDRVSFVPVPKPPRDNRFEAVEVVDETSKLDIADIREAFAGLAGELKGLTPTGRYQSLALTALEEAAMWAIKSVTHA